MVSSKVEGTAERCPACIRVYPTRVQLQVRAHGLQHNESILFDDEDDLTDIETMRWYIRKAIAIRNAIKYNDVNYMDDTPNDDVLAKMFAEYKRPEAPVVNAYQPHESVIAAQRDVNRLLARYGITYTTGGYFGS